jgi:hypothetical protein
MWETGGDYHNILLDSISKAVGIPWSASVKGLDVNYEHRDGKRRQKFLHISWSSLEDSILHYLLFEVHLIFFLPTSTKNVLFIHSCWILQMVRFPHFNTLALHIFCILNNQPSLSSPCLFTTHSQPPTVDRSPPLCPGTLPGMHVHVLRIKLVTFDL